jgi:hypothetical protein
MDEQVHVKGIPERRRDNVPEKALFGFVVGAHQLDPQNAEDAKSLKNSSDMGIHRKGRAVERTHHYAGRALRSYLGERAEKVQSLIITPRTRGLESAAAEMNDEGPKGLYQAVGLSTAKSRKPYRAFDFVYRSAGELFPRRIPSLQRIVGSLVSTFSGSTGQDDVDKLVNGIRLVAKVRCPMGVTHRPGNQQQLRAQLIENAGPHPI